MDSSRKLKSRFPNYGESGKSSNIESSQRSDSIKTSGQESQGDNYDSSSALESEDISYGSSQDSTGLRSTNCPAHQDVDQVSFYSHDISIEVHDLLDPKYSRVQQSLLSQHGIPNQMLRNGAVCYTYGNHVAEEISLGSASAPGYEVLWAAPVSRYDGSRHTEVDGQVDRNLRGIGAQFF
ncbi:hypothetical protein B0O99DRAFT_748327 [Bisporella sp. PMI_857]|nr:hypothetical protein B0O99DRAFT_748327 [Bisporella sp. PMI_857]